MSVYIRTRKVFQVGIKVFFFKVKQLIRDPLQVCDLCETCQESKRRGLL